MFGPSGRPFEVFMVTGFDSFVLIVLLLFRKLQKARSIDGEVLGLYVCSGCLSHQITNSHGIINAAINSFLDFVHEILLEYEREALKI
jgi:hypothetical protein